MRNTNHIIEQSREFVLELLKKRLAPWTMYHDVRHTEETVEACRDIGKASNLDAGQLEIVMLAAWFHDTGYTERVTGHEERSVEIAAAFLLDKRYPPQGIEAISACIMATMMPQTPNNIMEQVICDADMVYLGKKEFFEKNDLLKAEIEKRERRLIPEAEWLMRSIDFLSGQSYHTEYAKKNLQDGILTNIGILRGQLERIAGQEPGP